MHLDLATCLDSDRDEITRNVALELGDRSADPPAESTEPAVVVSVECTAVGVMIDVRRPDNARRYRYALDWHDQPMSARARLVGLAVTEAVDASRIELVAVPEPARISAPSIATLEPAPGEIPPAWSISLLGVERRFVHDGGIDSLGLAIGLDRRLSPQVSVVADVTAEAATVLVPSGAVHVSSLSTAPQIAYRSGSTERLRGEIAAGVRIGVVRMSGEAMQPTSLTSGAFMRVWLGPVITPAMSLAITKRLSITASFEAGVVATGAHAHDLGEDVASVGGVWMSFRLGLMMPL